MNNIDECLFIMNTNYRNGYIDGKLDALEEMYEYLYESSYEHRGEYRMAIEDMCEYIKNKISKGV